MLRGKIKLTEYLILFGVLLIGISFVAANIQFSPDGPDADYFCKEGEQIACGQSEKFSQSYSIGPVEYKTIFRDEYESDLEFREACFRNELNPNHPIVQQHKEFTCEFTAKPEFWIRMSQCKCEHTSSEFGTQSCNRELPILNQCEDIQGFGESSEIVNFPNGRGEACIKSFSYTAIYSEIFTCSDAEFKSADSDNAIPVEGENI